MKVVRILLKVVYWLLFLIFTLPLLIETVDNMSSKDIILSKLSDITMLIVVFVPLSLLFAYLGTFKSIKLFPNKRIGFKLLSILGVYFVLAMILVPLNEIITSNYSQEYKDALREITVAQKIEEKKKQEELAAKEAEADDYVKGPGWGLYNFYNATGLEIIVPNDFKSVYVDTSYKSSNATSLSNATQEFLSQSHKFWTLSNFITMFLTVEKIDNNLSGYKEIIEDVLPLSGYSFSDYKEIDVLGADKAYHARQYYDDMLETSEDLIVIFENDLIYCLYINHGLYAGDNAVQSYYVGYDFDYERAEILRIREDISLLITRLEFTENVQASDIDVDKFESIVLDDE